MTEILFVLATTALVFAFFLLVFSIKGISDRDGGQMPTCAHCDRHRSQGRHKHSLRNQKQIEKLIDASEKVRYDRISKKI